VGSDLSQLRTKAVRTDRGVVISGDKVFSTHGLDSDAVVVWCRFGPERSDLGAVLVPTDSPGFERGRAEHFMSGEQYCVMSMRDCTVPERYVLTDTDLFHRLFPVFNVERLGNTGRCLSAAERAFDVARDYALSRQIGGAPLSDKQGIRWKFADMRMDLDACRLLLDRAATNLDDDGFPRAYDTAIAKAFINQKAFSVAHEALQVMGASGYSSEYPVEYIFRRIRGWMIAGGAVEVLKNGIARDVFRQEKR
jgi:alkylation response protein AidB-like acyl-CoA dehydrogenase